MAEASHPPTAESGGGTGGPSGAGDEGGVPQIAKLALLGIVAAVQAVPGYTILAGDEWQPPEAEMFRITAAVAGAALFALVFMARRHVLRMRARTVVAWCAGAFVLAIALLYAYHAVLSARVVTFIFARQQFRALVPFGVSHWATGELLDVVQQSNGGVPATAGQVTLVHLRNALSVAGPGAVLDLIPERWRQITLGTLWLLYTAGLGLIVVGFGTAALRLGAGIVQTRRARKEAASAADRPAGKAPAAEPATPANTPAAPPPQAPAAVRAEVAPPAPAMPPVEVHANGNGKALAEPVMLRVELRAPAWAVASAAAALAWAAFRLASSRRDEPRRPPAPSRRERDPRWRS